MEEVDGPGASEAIAGMYFALDFKGKSFALQVNARGSHLFRYCGFTSAKAKEDVSAY